MIRDAVLKPEEPRYARSLSIRAQFELDSENLQRSQLLVNKEKFVTGRE